MHGPSQQQVSQTLTEYFSDARRRNLKAAKRALVLALGEIEKQRDIRADLWAGNICVLARGNELQVQIGHPSSEPMLPRPAEYEPPEGDSEPWLFNQYGLGKSFYAALSPNASPGSAAPIEQYVPELCGAFSCALDRMMAQQPDKRFQTPREAIRFVIGISERTGTRLHFGAAAIFVMAIAGALLLLIGPRFRTGGHPVDTTARPEAQHPAEAAAAGHIPREPKAPDRKTPEGMALFEGGSVRSGGARRQVSRFFLDRVPVTLSIYEAYATARGKRLPFGENAPYVRDFPNHPVWNVSWYEARDFCADNQKRLPAEVEWELATATGGYSWGTGLPPVGEVNLDTGKLENVGSTPGDQTTSGVFDLLGNIPQWMNDDSDSGKKVVRGGGYYLPPRAALAQMDIAPDREHAKGYLRIGFRCAAQ